jgi:hypothetical protein
MSNTEILTPGIQDIARPIPDNGDGAHAPSSEELLREIAGGLLYCHHRDNANTSRVLEMGAFLYALIELVTERGLLSMEEIEERKQVVGERLSRRFLDKGMGVLIQDGPQDKYSFNGHGRVDCEDRVHLCQAACCKMHFALSRQDLEEGVVRWNLQHPYVVAQGGDGYCAHLDRTSHRCTVYVNRPLPCRAYDCRQDERIWLDFEKKIVNPDLDKLFTKPTEREPVACEDD